MSFTFDELFVVAAICSSSSLNMTEPIESGEMADRPYRKNLLRHYYCDDDNDAVCLVVGLSCANIFMCIACICRSKQLGLRIAL